MRFRRILPVTFGLLSAALMAWDVYEEFLVEATGISDFAKLPVPETLLFTINAPVFPLVLPMFLAGWSTLLRHLAFLPFVIAWWCWLGARLDFGWLGKKPAAHPTRARILLALFATALFFLALRDFWNIGEYIFAMVRYRSPLFWPPVKTLGTGLWCLWLGAIAAYLAIRLSRSGDADRSQAVSRPGWAMRFSSAGFGFLAFAILFDLALQIRGTTFEWAIPPQPPRVFSAVNGVLTDEEDKPLDDVIVELLPERDRNDMGTHLETTKGGFYRFKVPPGAYRLALNCQDCLDAPTAKQPFETSFYPGVEQKVSATRIVVTAQRPVQLNPWRVRRLPVAAVLAQVSWIDGTGVEDSNLVINNLEYPRAIVQSVPSGRGGKGPVLLPMGFDYRARAVVTCDEGKHLSSHESRPLLDFAVRSGLTPKILKFVIQEMPCKAWHPK